MKKVYGLMKATDCDHSGYETIERILKDENHNLKQQNQLLLGEIYKMKNSQKKYKEIYRINQI